MKREDLNLSEFTGGWLVGNFEPSIFKRKNIEVGVKQLKQGFIDEEHWHEKSVEYNFILSGRIRIETGQELKAGETFVYKKKELSKCHVIEDTIILVIRDGSHANDKF